MNQIILVEDEPNAQYLIYAILTPKSFEVLTLVL
jgi:hypothetical protein